METFDINRRKIAKAVFVVFFVLMGIFCIVYASFGILNLLKIKNAFRASHTESVDISNPKVALLTRGDMTALVSSSGHIGLSCGDDTLCRKVFCGSPRSRCRTMAAAPSPPVSSLMENAR